MFSKLITSSARFLKMPVDSQSLYFHLGMNADDDGVVEAYPVMKTTGASEDNLRILTAKGLVKILNEDLVSYITDWNEHNLIRADRKVNSIYKDLLLKIVPEAEILEPKPRADTGVIPKQITTGRPVDGISKDRLGKDRIGKDNTEREEAKPSFATPTKEIVLKKELTPSEEMHLFLEEEDTFNKVVHKIASHYEMPTNLVEQEVRSFKSYWSERNGSGKKRRWELEKTFELNRRLSTWFKNKQRFNNKTIQSL